MRADDDSALAARRRAERRRGKALRALRVRDVRVRAQAHFVRAHRDELRAVDPGDGHDVRQHRARNGVGGRRQPPTPQLVAVQRDERRPVVAHEQRRYVRGVRQQPAAHFEVMARVPLLQHARLVERVEECPIGRIREPHDVRLVRRSVGPVVVVRREQPADDDRDRERDPDRVIAALRTPAPIRHSPPPHPKRERGPARKAKHHAAAEREEHEEDAGAAGGVPIQLLPEPPSTVGGDRAEHGERGRHEVEQPADVAASYPHRDGERTERGHDVDVDDRDPGESA